jgi:hypothetical protein
MPRRPIGTAVLASALAASAAGATDESGSAWRLLEQARTIQLRREPPTIIERLVQTSVGAGSRLGYRTRVFRKRLADGALRTLTVYDAPAVYRGLQVLALTAADGGEALWLSVPGQRVRRISPEATPPSDIGFGELRIFDELRRWTPTEAAAAIVHDAEPADGVPCAVIEVSSNLDRSYTRWRIWLHRADATIRRVEYLDGGGRVLKRLDISGFREVGGVPTPGRMTMENFAAAGATTAVEVAEVRYGLPLADDLFTSIAIERGPPTILSE